MGLLSEFSIQLYSLREEGEKDFPGMLRRVAQTGYTGVEFAGYGGLTAGEMKALLVECGLKPVGTHVSLERLETALDEELSYNREIGTQHIIVPHFDMAAEADVDDLALRMRAIAPRIREAGFGFGYHNHEFEFKTSRGRYLLDLLMEKVPADELFLELDIYWAAYADVNYMAYLDCHSDRIRLLHLKQMADAESKRCVDLEDGVIDFREIILLGQKNGVEHYILEQEEFDRSCWESIERDYRHIMGL